MATQKPDKLQKIEKKSSTLKNNKNKPKIIGKRATDGKEIIHVVEYDDKIRELLVPSSEPTVYPALLDIDEFERIKQEAKVITMQARLNKLEEEDREKNEQIQQCLARKDEMRKSHKQSKDKEIQHVGV
ncbi:hypothetical protein L9F63_020393 [Diploptera punctata]|uniref:Uncharacterized protein n=1 Tax=Diploptera punctata TaxID=6984 RepID=A0AAD7ZT27_DIPPU|nr:hypothetical protein L9F63_020393 [Diploptera punctata]